MHYERCIVHCERCTLDCHCVSYDSELGFRSSRPTIENRGGYRITSNRNKYSKGSRMSLSGVKQHELMTREAEPPRVGGALEAGAAHAGPLRGPWRRRAMLAPGSV